MIASKLVNNKARLLNPVALLIQEGSESAISKTLPPSASADDKLDPSANIMKTSSDVLPALPVERATTDARVDDSFQLIVRADTESGLKMTPTSRAMFNQTEREIQAPVSNYGTPSSSPQANDRRSRTFWRTTR